MRRLLLSITLSIVAVAFVACLHFMWTADSHHLNLRYVLWKHHAWRFEPEFMLKYLTSDDYFTLSLEGKTRADVQRYFPVLVPPDRPLTEYQKYYSKDMVAHHADYLWIGDSEFAVEFKDGKVAYIGPIKG